MSLPLSKMLQTPGGVPMPGHYGQTITPPGAVGGSVSFSAGPSGASLEHATEEAFRRALQSAARVVDTGGAGTSGDPRRPGAAHTRGAAAAAGSGAGGGYHHGGSPSRSPGGRRTLRWVRRPVMSQGVTLAWVCVRRCRLTASKPELKARLVSALETKM